MLKLDCRRVEVRQFLREGFSNVRIARHFSVGADTVNRFVRENNLARPLVIRGGEYLPSDAIKKTPPVYVRPFEPVAEGAERIISVTVVDCIGGAAAWVGVPVAEFISPGRSRRIARPRQFAMHLARELTDASLPRIGKLFGGRDHTTVLHAQRRVRKALSESAAAVLLLTEMHRYAAAHALKRAASNLKASAELCAAQVAQ